MQAVDGASAGKLIYHSTEDDAEYGGVARMDVTYTTPAGSPVRHKMHCNFDGDDEIDQVWFDSSLSLEAPPAYMRPKLNGKFVNTDR